MAVKVPANSLGNARIVALDHSTTGTGNSAGNTESLYKITLPANALGDKDGRGLRIFAAGQTGANGNSKNFGVGLNGSQVSQHSETANDEGWNMIIHLVRVSSDSFRFMVDLTVGADGLGRVFDLITATTADEDAALVVDIFGGGADASTVVCNYVMAEYIDPPATSLGAFQ